jgi:hypothetical protein
MRLVRFSALLAVFGITLFASSSQAGDTVPFNQYNCLCYCAETGTTVSLVDNSPNCNVCKDACR